jgi:very-short-patch-repair endonuclease
MRISDITPDYLRQHDIEPYGLLFSSNHLPYNPNLKEFSRNMRNYGEKAEALLWKRLKAKQTGFVFNRQKPILNYIADFYCKQLNLVVEIDGASHFSSEAYKKDQERDRQMRAIGLQIIRVNDSEVRKDTDSVAEYIKEQCLQILERMNNEQREFVSKAGS